MIQIQKPLNGLPRLVKQVKRQNNRKIRNSKHSGRVEEVDVVVVVAHRRVTTAIVAAAIGANEGDLRRV